VLEAMACGTPVVCSDTPALLEVAGDAAAMADATDVEGLVAALGEALGSPGRAEELARAGIARAATFTRSRMIDGHASVYQALAASTT
jgi:glycosyltransferase involved in cell wall biosynthesis